MNQTFLIDGPKAKEAIINFMVPIESNGTVQVEFKKGRSTRTSKQNALYWGLWLNQIHNWDKNRIDSLGYDVDDFHEDFKKHLLPRVYLKEQKNTDQRNWVESYELARDLGATDKQLLISARTASTTWATVDQFANYLQRIEAWSYKKAGLTLSRPEDRYFEALGYDRRTAA